ncbi:MAG: Trm112 family protein [Actinomycetota bacterium]
MTLDSRLLDILACPEDKGPLVHIDDEAVLFNPRLRRTYAIRDDIPIMLIDESTSLDDDEFERLSALVESRGLSPTFSDTE